MAGDGRLGHFVPWTHDVTPAARCGVARPKLVEVITALEPALRGRPIKAVIAREFVEGVGVVVVADAPVSLDGLRVPGTIGVGLRVDERDGNSIVGGAIAAVDGTLTGSPLDGGPACSVDAFCQADLGGAQELVALACKYNHKTFKPRDLPAIAELFGLEDLGRALPWSAAEREAKASTNDLGQVAGEIKEVQRLTPDPLAGFDVDLEGD